MGTNFYFTDESAQDQDDPKIHIGKRSGAGPYCHDCGVTLHADGSRAVHSDVQTWLPECPSCGRKEKDVGTTCSFTWTKMSHLQRIQDMVKAGNRTKCIRSENAELLTAAEFLDIISRCRISFQWCCRFS